MGNILLITDNDNIFERYKRLFDNASNSFTSCCNNTSILDLIEIEHVDVVIVDENIPDINLNLTIKKIKSKLENAQILLLTDGNNSEEDLQKYASGFILDNLADELVVATVNTHLKTKEKLDILSGKNKDLADSLYRLNVLYGTSSQFAGTLDTKELLTYMIEGLDKSLSFDLTCTISFGFENEPVLIINSLYDIS